jgi:hypothetical protein
MPFLGTFAGKSVTDKTIYSFSAIKPVKSQNNGRALFKKCKQLFEYQHLLLLRDIWWSKF